MQRGDGEVHVPVTNAENRAANLTIKFSVKNGKNMSNSGLNEYFFIQNGTGDNVNVYCNLHSFL
jgi:desulfoferrodoxin (superoxide reductase-like protein)